MIIQTLNSLNREIIWIDENVNNDENTGYINSITYQYLNIKVDIYNIKKFIDIDSAIKYIKTIKFKETFIIVSGNLYKDFVKTLKKNYTDIYVIPKIIIFTTEKRKQSLIKDCQNCNFFCYGGIKTSFNEIQNFLRSQQEENSVFFPDTEKKLLHSSLFLQDDQYLFDQIKEEKDLILPIFYKVLLGMPKIEENNSFIKTICSNYKEDSELYKLLNPIKNIPYIPVELLSKYFAKMYTFEGMFYKDIKYDLLRDEQDKKIFYMPYIKTLYEGAQNGGLKTCIEKELFSAAHVSEQEINELINYKQNKKFNLPTSIIFSKSFMSFSKTIEIAEEFYTGNKNVMLFLQKDEHRKFNLLTHADLEEISAIPREREVLFFPFSTFGIDNIEYNHEKKRYHFKLIYLGKFVSYFENNKQFKNSTENIPNTRFKEVFKKSKLVEENRINNLKIKEVAKEYKKYKESKISSFDFKKFLIYSLLAAIFIASIVTIIILAKKVKVNKEIFYCNAGYYYNLNSNSSLCFPCPNGTYSDGNSEKCTNCSAGYYSKEGSSSCTICKGGTFSNEGAQKCTNCSAGYYSEEQSSSCTICKGGTFSNEGAHNCTNCSAGYYSEEGSSSCKQCPIGKFNNIPGSSSCFNCPEGTFSNITGATSCLLCSPGSYSSHLGAYLCTKCDYGTVSNNYGATSCLICPNNTITEYIGSTYCRKCNNNEYPSKNRTYCIKQNSKYYYLKYYLIFVCLLLNL